MMTYTFKLVHCTCVVKKKKKKSFKKIIIRIIRKIWQEAKAEKRAVVSNTEHLAQKKIMWQ